jgi:Zn ribbon nucleic-acid-binding protein
MIELLLLAPSEVAHLEAECPACHHLSVYDPMRAGDAETAVCPHCGHRWPEQYEALAALRRALEVARRAADTVKLRLRNA